MVNNLVLGGQNLYFSWFWGLMVVNDVLFVEESSDPTMYGVSQLIAGVFVDPQK